MQTKSLFSTLFLLGTLSAAHASDIATENFNSRKGTSVQQVRSTLQGACWTFHHFDINLGGWNPGIEGDGAMVSSAEAIGHHNAGIYTPLLTISADIDISFDYTFNHDFDASTSRWLKICLTDAQNNIVRVLEEIKFIGVNATRVMNYSTSFKNIGFGEFRLVLLYGGAGGSANIALDNLHTSAPYRFAGGCNDAPRVLTAKVTGMPDRTAKGSLTGEETKNAKALLVKGSAHGRVDIQPDGTFVFHPNDGFTGKTTSFVYRLCNDSGGNLCSPPTTLLIQFPSAENHLAAFQGSYKYGGNVELAWHTTPSADLQKFEIERSTDGYSWQRSAVIDAKQVSNVNGYTYTDRLSKNTVLKKDLYYRLKQVQADGSISTSRLLIVRVYNTKAVTMISVTPDPSKKDLAVNVQLQEDSYVSLKITDHSGNVVIKQTAEGQSGSNVILVEGSSSLSPGNYMLDVIVNSKERMLVKLTKE